MTYLCVSDDGRECMIESTEDLTISSMLENISKELDLDVNTISLYATNDKEEIEDIRDYVNETLYILLSNFGELVRDNGITDEIMDKYPKFSIEYIINRKLPVCDLRNIWDHLLEYVKHRNKLGLSNRHISEYMETELPYKILYEINDPIDPMKLIMERTPKTIYGGRTAGLWAAMHVNVSEYDAEVLRAFIEIYPERIPDIDPNLPGLALGLYSEDAAKCLIENGLKKETVRPWYTQIKPVECCCSSADLVFAEWLNVKYEITCRCDEYSSNREEYDEYDLGDYYYDQQKESEW